MEFASRTISPVPDISRYAGSRRPARATSLLVSAALRLPVRRASLTPGPRALQVTGTVQVNALALAAIQSGIEAS